jgi:hypothetical protein
MRYKIPWYQLDRRLGGLQVWYHHCPYSEMKPSPSARSLVSVLSYLSSCDMPGANHSSYTHTLALSGDCTGNVHLQYNAVTIWWCMVTSLCEWETRNNISIRTGLYNFLTFQNGSGVNPASYPADIRGSFPVGKAAGA